MRYQPVNVNIDESQEKRLTRAIQKNTVVSVRIIFEPSSKTKNQIEKIERAKLMGQTDLVIKMTSVQVKANVLR